QSLLPIMEEVAEKYPDYQFIVAGAPGFDANFYSNILTRKLEVVYNQTYKLLRNSNAAIVASGTATFETALLNIPQIVVYKMGLGWLLSIFRKFILKTKYFSFVNLVAEKEIVKELFQGEVKLKTIQEELNNILNTKEYRMKMLHNYSELKQKSNTEGAAIAAAKLIVQSIKNHK
ncbi:MAG: lipid-A-disaccharide synthase, partial [Prolixibacteraceae bacterium]|nr:lipid-A-disaccharide synthase [Prolixibacteraceae bacterium]